MINGGKPTTTSRLIAEAFGKQHKNVIQNIEKLEYSEDFSRLNTPTIKERKDPNTSSRVTDSPS